MGVASVALANPPFKRHIHKTHFSPCLWAPTLLSGEGATGVNETIIRRKNPRCHHKAHEVQRQLSYWSQHLAKARWTAQQQHMQRRANPAQKHRVNRCPAGSAMLHPAAPTPLRFATRGCPTNTGRIWLSKEIEATVARGPHKTAKTTECMEQLYHEATEKERTGQANIVLWDDIKDNLPK